MKRESIRTLKWVVGLQFKASRAAFFWNIFYSIYFGVVSIVEAYVGAKFITSITVAATERSGLSTVYLWLSILFVVELLGIGLRSINNLVTSRMDQKLRLITNELFMHKLYALSQEQFDDEEFNTKISRAQDGMYRFWRATDEIARAVSSSITFVAAITAILVVAPVVGIIIIISILPMTLIRIRINKFREQIYKDTETDDRIAARTGWYLSDPQYMPEVRLINGFQYLMKAWRKHTKKSQDITFSAEKKGTKIEAVSDTVQPLIEFLANIYFLRLLVAGTIGLDRFLFLRGILSQASGSALSVAGSMDTLHTISIDLKNFNEVYHTKPAIPNGTVKVGRPLTIEFKNVSFKYPHTEALVLDGVSFLMVPGSRLALVGENGAGKTTLIKLLLRQYLPTSGQILVNGVDMKDVEQESYFESLSILSQDFLTISHLTIKDNMLIGVQRDVTDKEIWETFDMVGAREFIEKLPHKMNQRLDSSFDDGSNLSGGQMQRLGVARALFRNSDVMLLDEPTSAIDAKAELKIFNNIYREHADRTTLIISHRFSTVRKADKIIVMEQGKIIEYGSHEELLDHGGLYKEMFEAQAEGYR